MIFLIVFVYIEPRTVNPRSTFPLRLAPCCVARLSSYISFVSLTSSKSFPFTSLHAFCLPPPLNLNHIYLLQKHTGEGGAAFLGRSDVETCRYFKVFPSYPLSFDILAHSFAHTKSTTHLFSGDSALFAKNTREWGGGPKLQTLQPANFQSSPWPSVPFRPFLTSLLHYLLFPIGV